MKTNRRRRLLERVYIEALVIGLCIGLAAVLLDQWLSDNSWRVRILALLLVGGSLCLIQYAIVHFGKRK